MQRQGSATVLHISLLNVAGLFAGAIAKSYSCRLVVALGVILQVVGYIDSAFTYNLHFLYITYGIIAGEYFKRAGLRNVKQTLQMCMFVRKISIFR